MSQPSHPSATGFDAATHVGWLIIAPDHQPYAWYTYDQALSHDEESAMARFEPDTACRHDMLVKGWSVRAGSAMKLVGGTGDYAKASA